jgi:hypothetical protein
MANYHQLKNAAILTPTESTDLGSDANRYSNVFMSGNIMMSNGVTVTSTNVITPKIASITYPGNDTAADIAGGQTLTITGSGFSAGASVLIGTTPSTVVTVVSSTSITFTSPVLSAGNYALYVINSDGGTAIYIPGIAYSGTPTWSTSSGNIASVYETNSISSTVAATGDATISYSLNSGTLPTGSTLNSSTGLISGTAPASAGVTTYSFSIRATDGQNQDTDRSFTITVNTDAVTWVSPADNTSTALELGAVMSTVTLNATSAAGKSITYTANALPTGVSISTNTVVGTPTVVGSTTSLITATAADSGRTATRTLSWVVSVGAETYWPYVTLLLNGEGAAATNNANNNTYVDSSTNAYAVTTSGTPVQGTFSPYGSNWSYYFDGTGDCITIPSNSAIQLGTSDFTVECWAYLASGADANSSIFAQLTTAGAEPTAAGVLLSRNTIGVGNVNGASFVGASVSMSLLTWTHVALTRQSGSLRIYLDGVQQGSTLSDSRNLDSTLANIGGRYGDLTGSYLWNGYISNLRVLKGTALYTASSFTPPTAPLTAIANTVLLTCQSNRFKDNSASAVTMTRNGDASVTKFSPFNSTTAYAPATYGGSVYFPGSSYLTISSGSLLNVSASSNWTAEAWIYPMSSVSGYRMIFQGSGVSLTFYDGQAYYTNNAQGLTTGGGISASNQWYHVAWVNNASVSSKIYINGVQTATGGALGFTATATFIGASNGGGESFIGYIADMRIVRGTAVYTSSFTPPTTPLTAIANTALLISATNSGVIDQSGQHNLTTGGTAKISTSIKKYGSSSIYFPVKTDYLAVKVSPGLITFAGNFTFECWIYPTDATISGIFSIWDSRQTGSSASAMVFGLASLASPVSGSWRMYYFNGTNYYAPGNQTVLINQWTHVAWARVSSTLTYYVNGIADGTATISGVQTGTATTNPIYIGSKDSGIGGYGIVGYIDDLRITNGYARYTSNFTAPTSAFVTK